MTTQSLLRRLAGPTKQIAPAAPFTIRHATPDDADALTRLAELDSSRPPRGVVLLAEVAGEPWAAISLDDHHAVADPFRPTGELVFMLVERARQLRSTEHSRSHRLPRVWPSLRDASV
jgi:hypothetical protein